MSRLAPTDAPDLPARPRDAGPVLRRHRRRPLHPDRIAEMLRTRAADSSGGMLGGAPHGWLVIVTLEDRIGPNGFPRRIVRDLEPGTTLADARAVLREMLREHGPRNAWIVARSRPDQKGVRP